MHNVKIMSSTSTGSKKIKTTVTVTLPGTKLIRNVYEGTRGGKYIRMNKTFVPLAKAMAMAVAAANKSGKKKTYHAKKIQRGGTPEELEKELEKELENAIAEAITQINNALTVLNTHEDCVTRLNIAEHNYNYNYNRTKSVDDRDDMGAGLEDAKTKVVHADEECSEQQEQVLGAIESVVEKINTCSSSITRKCIQLINGKSFQEKVQSFIHGYYQRPSAKKVIQDMVDTLNKIPGFKLTVPFP